MRRALVIGLAAALAACGSDDNDNGGNPTPAANINVTGANTFTATNAIGFSTGGVTCSIDPGTGTGPVSVTTSLIAVFATDVSGDVCALVNANQEKKGAGGVGIVIARANALGGTPPALAAGQYTLSSSSSFPAPDIQGNVTFATAFASKNAPGTCGAADAEAESGSVTIDSVSNGVVRGSISANLVGGGTISGSFTTSACSIPSASACGTIIDDSPDACVD
jgi:hypothetical protein